MRAIALADFETQPDVLDLPVPEPAAGEVLIRVNTASVNGFDLVVVSGVLKEMMEHRFPVVLGKDFAGTVDSDRSGCVPLRGRRRSIRHRDEAVPWRR